LIFFYNLSRKCKFHWHLTRIMINLHKDQYTFVIISRSVILSMKNETDKMYREKRNTCFNFNTFFNRTVYEIMCEKYCRVGQATDYNIIWRVRIACWITKAKNNIFYCNSTQWLQCFCLFLNSFHCLNFAVSNLPMNNCQDTVVSWLLLRNNFVTLHVLDVFASLDMTEIC
jgi:hypothetical protein